MAALVLGFVEYALQTLRSRPSSGFRGGCDTRDVPAGRELASMRGGIMGEDLRYETLTVSLLVYGETAPLSSWWGNE